MQDLDNFKNEMNLSGQNVYVGHRYVPKMGGDWDNSKTYEALTIVQYQGNSFTSRQPVPSGIDISNEDYWVSTGNYNAQIEQYRQDVTNLGNDINKYNNLNSEVINARNGEQTLSERLDNDKQEITNKLAQTDEKILTVNVKDFGAIGDGETDDTQAINDAIDYANGQGGGVVKIPNGVYMINATKTTEVTTNYLREPAGVNLKSNVYLSLEIGTQLRAIPTTDGAYKIINIADVENVGISGGSIYGERKFHIGGSGEWGYGIAVLGSKNVKINNISIYDCWGDGINLQVAPNHDPNDVPTNVYIDNVLSSNNYRQGMSIEAGENVFVKNSIFEKTNGTPPQSGVDIEPFNNTNKVNNVSFINCVFRDNVGSGLVIQQKNVQNIKAMFCYFEGNAKYEVLAYDSKGITIANSTLIGDPSNPIGVRMYNVDDGYFTGNNFIDSAFDFGEVRGFRINDNIMRATGTNINVQPFNISTMNNTSITHNTFDYRGVGESSHHLPLRGRNIVFSDNEIINVSHGVYVFSTNTVINNNKIHDCRVGGFEISSKTVKLDSNIFTNVCQGFDSVIRILATSEDVIIKNSAYYKDSWLTGKNNGLPVEGFVRVYEGAKKIEVVDTTINPMGVIVLELPVFEPSNEKKISGRRTWKSKAYKYSKLTDILYGWNGTVDIPFICVKEATFDSEGNMLTPPEFAEFSEIGKN